MCTPGVYYVFTSVFTFTSCVTLYYVCTSAYLFKHCIADASNFAEVVAAVTLESKVSVHSANVLTRSVCCTLRTLRTLRTLQGVCCVIIVLFILVMTAVKYYASSVIHQTYCELPFL